MDQNCKNKKGSRRKDSVVREPATNWRGKASACAVSPSAPWVLMVEFWNESIFIAKKVHETSFITVSVEERPERSLSWSHVTKQKEEDWSIGLFTQIHLQSSKTWRKIRSFLEIHCISKPKGTNQVPALSPHLIITGRNLHRLMFYVIAGYCYDFAVWLNDSSKTSNSSQVNFLYFRLLSSLNF